MTARGTDWSLALLITLLFASGLGTWLAGDEDDAWIVAGHGIAGCALAILLVWKLRRVWRRLRPPAWDTRTGRGAAALVLVGATLVTGWLWVTAGALYALGFSLLAWHAALGGLLTLVVVFHLAGRARLPRRGELTSRRQLLEAGAIGVGGLVAWRLQGAFNSVLDLPGSRRRFTGSYERGSFQGNAFPTTSWVADDPRPLDRRRYELEVGGLAREALAVPIDELSAGEAVVATLDCTGGFYSTQRWTGTRVTRLLERAGPEPEAGHVRVISVTGYRWSFSLEDAEALLLAAEVGGEPLSHGHGAPLRLVAPGRRGFEWVKWVVRLELASDPDYGAVPSTIWSSFTAAGRGRA